MIWNEWYRDQDLETPVTIDTTSGEDSTTNVGFLNCSWEKDYFTTSRPWPQKGPSVSIPVYGNDTNIQMYQSANPNDPRGMVLTATDNEFVAAGAGFGATSSARFSTDDPALEVRPEDLRTGMALQRYEEARARYGSRYTEYLRYLGVRSSDARLQRPEYLGGGKQTVQFSEVLQTAPTTNGYWFSR